MSKQTWKASAQCTITQLLDSEPNERNAIFLNALIGVVDYLGDDVKPDYVSGSLIDEKKQESLNYFIDYMNEKSAAQKTGAELHKQYAEIALKKMLELDEEIAIMLYKSANEQERKIIKKSFVNILNKL